MSLGYGLEDRRTFRSGSQRGKWFSLRHRLSPPVVRSTQYPSQRYCRLFPCVKRPSVKLTAHVHPVPRSRTLGAIHFHEVCLLKHRYKFRLKIRPKCMAPTKDRAVTKKKKTESSISTLREFRIVQNERKLQCDDNAYCYCYCTNVVPVFFNSFNCLANTVDLG